MTGRPRQHPLDKWYELKALGYCYEEARKELGMSDKAVDHMLRRAERVDEQAGKRAAVVHWEVKRQPRDRVQLMLAYAAQEFRDRGWHDIADRVAARAADMGEVGRR